MSLKLAKSERFSWMDNVQLTHILNDIPEFRGVYAKDTLPSNVTNYPAAFIVNSARAGGNGEHWLAAYFDREGNGDFFDSYGYSPARYGVERFIQSNNRRAYTYNKKPLQSALTLVCGAYCVYYIMMKSSGVKEWLIPFGNDKILNDAIVLDFVNRFAVK